MKIAYGSLPDYPLARRPRVPPGRSFGATPGTPHASWTIGQVRQCPPPRPATELAPDDRDDLDALLAQERVRVCVAVKDNLYEFGGGLVWEFVKTWSLRPEILYIRDQSNAVGFNYSSTEVWINIRKAF